MKKFWQVKWSYSPSGGSYVLTTLPVKGCDIWFCFEAANIAERDALCFEDEGVAWGVARTLASFFGVSTPVVIRRWNGFPEPEPCSIVR